MAKLSYPLKYQDVFFPEDLKRLGDHAERVEEIMKDNGLSVELSSSENKNFFFIVGEGKVLDVVEARREMQSARYQTDDVQVNTKEEAIYVEYATYGLEAEVVDES